MTFAFGAGRSEVRAEGKVDGNLSEALVAAGLPPPVGADILAVLSYDFDLQRDIGPGSKFRALYEQFAPEGSVARPSRLLYVDIETVAGRVKYYRNTLPNGDSEFFLSSGKSARKDLLRTPVDGARLSSGFGMRLHPILGYSRMHQGVDFAAIAGTPVYAAGYGLVEYAGAKGSYGLFVRLYHHSGYGTGYAHLRAIAPEVRPGARVRQGQVIGWVGATGRATGPHLHYEIAVGGRKCNPQEVLRPSAIELEGTDLTRLRAAVGVFDRTVTAVPLAQELGRR